MFQTGVDMTTTLVLADDHPLFRQGLKSAIEGLDGCEVVAEANDGAEAKAAIAEHLPQIAFIDLAMPESDGYGVVEWATDHAPDTACIIMTMYKDPEYLHRAVDLGAQGFLVKDDAYGALADCLAVVGDGDFYVSPSLGTPMPPDPIARRRGEGHREIEKLTPAQLAVLRHIAEFKTSREIAVVLGISPKTVENHRMNIAQAVGLNGPNRLLRFAVQHVDLI
jgi:DNA-binding NarL/FixJ family response regulator